jgi:hypothetical protein
LFDEAYADGGSIALTQRVAACLARFGEHNDRHRLPWAAPLTLTAAAPETFSNVRFADKTGLREGRPPFSVGSSLQALSNEHAPTDEPPPASNLGTLSDCPDANPTHSSCRLLRSDNCPEFLPVAGYPTPADGNHVGSDDGWWDKWKDHLFYVVAPGFAPAASPAADCELEPDQCLMVNGDAYAAAVIFSGSPLTGQQRDVSSDRQNADNYLEDENALTLKNGGQRLVIAGNDQIACLKGPTSASPGFRLVPNCGNPVCRAEAGKLLERVSGNRNRCRQDSGPSPECQTMREQLTGCACRGEAEIFLGASCLESLDSSACRAAIRGLETCA